MATVSQANSGDYSVFKGHKIGRILRKLGKVQREHVHEALQIQKAGRKVPIGQLLVELGYISQRDVAEGLAAQAGMGYVDLADFELTEELQEVIPSANVRTFQVVPIEYQERSKRLTIAMKSANNFRAVDDLRLLLGATIKAVVADEAQIDAIISEHFAKEESIADAMSDLASDDKFKGMGASDQSIDLEAVAEAAG
ncbi:MAG: pilus assembly protein PilB, partial [Planctomycetota bacterium]